MYIAVALIWNYDQAVSFQSALMQILNAGIAAVRPSFLFPPLLTSGQLQSWIDGTPRYLLALGKASIDSARTILSSAKATSYFILSPYDDAEGTLTVHVGSHPIPDHKSYRATAALLDWIKGLPTGQLLVVLSGGTSALCVHPLDTVSMQSKMQLNDLLLRSGASIHEINSVRKHISAVKGGQMAGRVEHLQTTVLAISDVIGDDLSVIGSGLFYPDPTTFLDAKSVLTKYGIWNDTPEDVRWTIEQGCNGEIPETPKEGELNITHAIIASNSIAREAAALEASKKGFRIRSMAEPVQGDVELAAEMLLTRLNEMQPGSALVAGGEVTVHLRGNGTGGRNQHLALLMAEKIRGKKIVFAAAGTDGVDGNSMAAGAWVDGETFSKAGNDLYKSAVQNCDSYSFFQKLQQSIVTGPTGTNVMDLYIALKDPAS